MSNGQARFSIDRRIRFLQVVVLSTVAVLLMSLFFFQIIKANEYVRLASQNRLRIIRIAPPRGTITDCKGAPLAANVRTFSVNGYPIDLQRENNIKLVSSVLIRNGIPVSEEDLKKIIEKQYSAPYRAITVASNLTFAQAAELITDKDFSEALFITPVWKRTYPAGNFTAHAVGYVAEITKDELDARKESSYRGGDMIGKNGIEAWYDEDLHGLPGEEVIEVDAKGRKLRDISYSPPHRGSDSILTIDLSAQRYAAELMGNFRGAIVAMDVKDGSVKCLYSSPSYDPNPFTWGISNREWAALTDHKERPMMNRAISGGYPPASTFKIVTASSVLENKIVTTKTIVRCPGYFELGDRRFRCWKRSGHGPENILGALKDSCDVYFYQTATWLGIDRLIRTAAKYGVGEKTGIDLIGEISGTLAGPGWKKERIKENWYGGDTVNYSIGQGYVLMTPIQLVRAYSAIANGGKMLKPRINSKAEIEFRDLNISPEIIKIMQEGLLEVTSSGTGRRASSFGVQVAGKTGTAQNAHGEDHAWFAGYAPAKAPRYAVVVIAEAGKGGGAVAGPMVGKLLNFLINGNKYAEPVSSSPRTE
ncbi:MAG: penicillin-binding protein 2 [Synergistaceae bacterium]|nr:penicillin-binding protein 2 [Synergistaceae bacterium]